MRLVSLVLLAWLIGAAPAPTPSLLETVLYVVSALEAREDDATRTTVEQDENSLQADLVSKNFDIRAQYFVKKIDDCKFEIAHKYLILNAKYEIDFSGADVDNAHLVTAMNRFSRTMPAVRIPGAQFCLIEGRTYLNVVAPGTCRSDFDVDVPSTRTPDDYAKMFAAIRRLKLLCAPKTS